MNSLLKELAHPIVRRIRQGRFYDTYEAAAAAAGTPYDTEELTRFRVERAWLNRPTRPYANASLPFLISATVGLEAPVVVDFGGATGDVALQLADFVPGVRFVVVETPGMARACADIFTHCAFSDTPPADCDVFYSSSTLQYVPDPHAVLAAGFRAARRAVILTRNTFADRRTFHVQQSRLGNNGGGDILPKGFDPRRLLRYPHGTLIYDEVLRLAGAEGWTLRLRIANDESTRAHGPGMWGADLLFTR